MPPGETTERAARSPAYSTRTRIEVARASDGDGGGRELDVPHPARRRQERRLGPARRRAVRRHDAHAALVDAVARLAPRDALVHRIGDGADAPPVEAHEPRGDEVD